jgi:hypothetical protein
MLDRRLARHARRQEHPGRLFPLVAGGAGYQQTFGEPLLNPGVLRRPPLSGYWTNRKPLFFIGY